VPHSGAAGHTNAPRSMPHDGRPPPYAFRRSSRAMTTRWT